MLNPLLTTVLLVLGPTLGILWLLYAACLRLALLPDPWVAQRRLLLGLGVLALVCSTWLVLRLAYAHHVRQRWQDSAPVRAARERFMLPRDFQYGELLIPSGSLINRHDPFDQGEPLRPLALHGLDAVRFARPVQIAGAWAQAVQLHPLLLELAQDQVLGPVYRYNNASQAWEPNPVAPALACRQGQSAVFHAPAIVYDVRAELNQAPPDGPQARFKPSQWLFLRCENGPRIALEPPAANAPAQVWSTP
jgi:hypothetical protein